MWALWVNHWGMGASLSIFSLNPSKMMVVVKRDGSWAPSRLPHDSHLQNDATDLLTSLMAFPSFVLEQWDQGCMSIALLKALRSPHVSTASTVFTTRRENENENSLIEMKCISII